MTASWNVLCMTSNENLKLQKSWRKVSMTSKSGRAHLGSISPIICHYAEIPTIDVQSSVGLASKMSGRWAGSA